MTLPKQLIAHEIDNIDNAFRHIDEINAFPWHDEPLQAEDDYRKLMFIDQNLNPAYLRLTEAVLKPLLMIPAYFSRIGRGKGTAKLDLYDISAELAGTDLRRQCRAIIRKSLRKARNERPYTSLLRYLPLGYARVHIFQKDFRRRKLANFGLAENLVGTLQIKRIKRIEAPDIAGSTIEYRRRVRIAWNRRWMENQATANDIES